MIETVFKFQHDSNKIPVAMGFAEEIDNKCREIINFSTFSNFFIKNDLFNDSEEAPSVLTSITGVLEKALSVCKTEEEKIYLLYIFGNSHKHSTDAIIAWDALENEPDSKQKTKMKMLMELVELKAFTEDDRKNLVTPKDMFKKIEVAKQNMYNFDKYYSIVNESEN